MSSAFMTEFHQAINKDPEFQIAARLCNLSMKIEMGDKHYILNIRDGKIAEINSAPTAFDSWDVFVKASEEEWKKFFEPIPKPFYQDLFCAALWHGFSYGGDLESFFAYYPAFRRMFEVMRMHAAK